MGDRADIRQLSDPDFLAERARVRETIEALRERMADLDDEFTKRASAAWKEAAR
jgi:cell division protein FtsB